jgi:hypothetical protein
MSVPTRLKFDFVDPKRAPKSKIHAYVTVTYGDFTIPGFKVVDPSGKDAYVLFPSTRVNGGGESGDVQQYKSTTWIEDAMRRQSFDEMVLACWRREVAARAKTVANPA